jgi:hypothetical protein
MNQEFLMIRNQEEPYTFKYNTLPPAIIPYEAAEKSERELTLVNVADWVEQWGRPVAVNC